jgi:hypothetical protein
MFPLWEIQINPSDITKSANPSLANRGLLKPITLSALSQSTRAIQDAAIMITH